MVLSMYQLQKLNRISINCTESLKYIFPFSIYNAIDYCVSRPPRHMWEFFTNSEYGYSVLLDYLKNTGYHIRESSFDSIYNCYCIEIVDPRLQVMIREFNDPFNYMDYNVFVDHAVSLGYPFGDELLADFEWYHNRVGNRFKDMGLL